MRGPKSLDWPRMIWNLQGKGQEPKNESYFGHQCFSFGNPLGWSLQRSPKGMVSQKIHFGFFYGNQPGIVLSVQRLQNQDGNGRNTFLGKLNSGKIRISCSE